MKSTLREYKSPQKNFCRQHLPHSLFCSPLVLNFPTELFCKQSPEFFWLLLTHPSTDRNETRTWSSLSPRNLRIKFGANLSTIFLVIVVTDRHTNTQTHSNQRRWKHSLAVAGITIHIKSKFLKTKQKKTDRQTTFLATIHVNLC